MALRKVLDMEHYEKELRRKSRTVEKFDQRLASLLDDMAETMYAAPGVGLAAPQVGILRKAVVIDVGEGLVELVNPQILRTEGEREWTEGCLSVPGYWGLTKRPEKVWVRAQNRNGEWFEKEGEDMFGLAMIHEIEHLDGILYVDHVIGGLQPDKADEEE
ncbi:MAG: peptide deformylase [Eubacteriales bacterium]|nr:peptide deformylase [Eubacteriales bacterium]